MRGSSERKNKTKGDAIDFNLNSAIIKMVSESESQAIATYLLSINQLQYTDGYIERQNKKNSQPHKKLIQKIITRNGSSNEKTNTHFSLFFTIRNSAWMLQQKK